MTEPNPRPRPTVGASPDVRGWPTPAELVRRVVARLFGPEHCQTCGDEFVPVTFREGYHRDGTPNLHTYRQCPRRGRPDSFDKYDRVQRGRCHGLSPMACAVERETYAAHRPWWGSCRHDVVSEDGRRCWIIGGEEITRDGRRVAA